MVNSSGLGGIECMMHGSRVNVIEFMVLMEASQRLQA
jgi:hypothetical protein